MTKNQRKYWPNIDQKLTKNWPKINVNIDQKSTKNWPKIDQKLTKNWPKIDSKIDQKLTKNWPKIDQNLTHNGYNFDCKSPMGDLIVAVTFVTWPTYHRYKWWKFSIWWWDVPRLILCVFPPLPLLLNRYEFNAIQRLIRIVKLLYHNWWGSIQVDPSSGGFHRSITWQSAVNWWNCSLIGSLSISFADGNVSRS